jgi:hypothetical protein
VFTGLGEIHVYGIQGIEEKVGIDLHLQGSVLHCLCLPPEVVLFEEGSDDMVVQVVKDVSILLWVFFGEVGISDLAELLHDIGKELSLLPIGSVGKIKSQQKCYDREGNGVVEQGGGELVEHWFIDA